MVAGAAGMVLASWSWTLREAAPLWAEAVEQGVVKGALSDWARSLVERLTGQDGGRGDSLTERWQRGFTREDRGAVEGYLSTKGQIAILSAQALCFDSLYVDGLARIRRQKLELAEEDRAVADLSRLWGSEGLRKPEATMAQKFYVREILNGAANGGLQRVRATPQHRDLFPYMRYATGENPRANHAALDGFVWRTGSPIETVVIPPNGWACNCRPIPIPWSEAEAAGYRGDYPEGIGPLNDFLALGGHDEGFPKGVFVDGLPNSIAGC